MNVPQILTTADLFSRRQEKLDEKKESIAFIASQLMENPEANVRKKFAQRNIAKRIEMVLICIDWTAKAVTYVML